MGRDFLARYPLFRLLSAARIEDWIASGQEIASDTGTILLQENTPGAWVYIVLDGRVRILRHQGQREITLGTLLPGDVFGEYALLSPGRNTATCRVAAPSRLVCLPLGPLRAAIQDHKMVWRNLKNWLRLHTLLHFYRQRTFLGFQSAESGLKLLDRLQPATFAAGQTIQANGLAAGYWHLIEQGTVRLQNGNGDMAAVDLGLGETFGEWGLTGSENLPTATAVTDVVCQVLSCEDFDPIAHTRLVQSYQARMPAGAPTHSWVPQEEVADCGLAALAMVGLRLGVAVTVANLRVQTSLGPHGLSMERLQTLAVEIGLPCRAVWVSVDRLSQTRFPAIVHMRNGHYVVLHELTKGGVLVGDPASGIVTWGVEYLAHCYSGALLLFDLR
jgi:CRP-like cAMP-binding protein